MKMRYKIFLSYILFIAASNIGMAQEIGVNVAVQDNKIMLGSPEIAIVNGQFSVLILEDDYPVQLKPFGQPTVIETGRRTPAGKGTETRYTWNDYRGYKYSLAITKIGRDIVSLRAFFDNGSLKPVRLKRFVLLDTPDRGFSVKGKATDWMLSSTDVESRRWGTLDKEIPTERELIAEKAYSRKYLIIQGNREKVDNRAWRGYYDDATLYRKPGKLGLSMAAVDTISDVYINVKVDKTRMKLEVNSEMSEILVGSGEIRRSDEVLFIYKPWAEAQQVRNRWIASVSGAKVTKKPVFGWCSWYRSGTSIKEEDVERIAEYTREHRNKIPFDVIQVDDGWQKGKNDWTENEKFSRGLVALANTIKDAGSVAGIWLSPVMVDPIKGKDGKDERPFPVEWYVNYNTGHPSMDRLDPTHPGVRAFIRRSLKYSYDRGYRYFKLDFSKVPFEGKRFYNQKFTRFQVQRELYRLFRNTIGDESYLLSCGISDQRSLVPYIDADRIGTDSGAKWGFARGLASDNKPAQIHGFWFPIHSMVNVAYENGVLSNADPDVTFLGQLGKCTPKQLETFHSFIGLFGGARMVSTFLFEKDFDKMDHLRLLQTLYPAVQEKGHPFAGGWDVHGREFGTVVNRKYGDFINLILWNPEHQGTANIGMQDVPTETLGNKFHAWSFWDEEYKGMISKDYVANNIPKYEHQLLRLTPITDRPTLIGSNLHIGMGAVEIKNIEITASKLTITMDPNAGCRNGRLYFYSRQPLGKAISTNSDAFVLRKKSNIYVAVLTNRNRGIEETLTLDIGKTKPPTLKEVLHNKQLKAKYNASSFTRTWEKSW